MREKGTNPRDVIERTISDENCRVLDMCCGTLCNGIPIAKTHPSCKVYGIDKSKDMLKEAKRKIIKSKLKNVMIKMADATASGLNEKIFDYIVIGLVLHECSKDLRADILKEAYRLLKDDGQLIILEWERKNDTHCKIKYVPLYALEVLNCRDLKEFYNFYKIEYFHENGFKMLTETHCNYSSVMVFNKTVSESVLLFFLENAYNKVTRIYISRGGCLCY